MKASSALLPPFRRHWPVQILARPLTKTSRKSDHRPNPAGKKGDRVYSWGFAETGALGLDSRAQAKFNKFLNRPIRHHFAESNRVVDVECGFGFTVFAVRSDSLIKLYGCGINTDWQLGLQKSPRGEQYGLIASPVPIDVGISDKDCNVIGLSAGRAHLAVATDTQGVFLTGNNSYGQCGYSITSDKSQCRIRRVPSVEGESVIGVECGQDHTFLLTESGKLFSFGLGADGQTGLGHFESEHRPTLVKGDICHERIVKVASTSDTALALSDKGDVFGWGNNEYMQLMKNSSVQQINSPIILDNVCKLGRIVDVASAGSFSAVLNEAGEVFVWGYGILGCGPRLERSIEPIQIPRTLFGDNVFQPDTRVVSITSGLSHLAAINSLNHLYTWGKNRYGCLGIGHVKDQFFPYRVALSGLVKKVSCGVDHMMILAESYD